MNKKVVLVSRPIGDIKMTDFSVTTEPVNTSIKQGDVLVRLEWVSIEPAQRIWISGVHSYTKPISINQVVSAHAVGTVITSKSPLFKRGDFVLGRLGWQEYAVIKASELIKLPTYENPQHYLSIYGSSGLTAYFSVFEIAKVRQSDTLLVSTAAGSVGSLICQLGKMIGCKVVGLVGSEAKKKYIIEELKVDLALNYKTSANLSKDIRELCPAGIDVYFDHVGGDILDAALANAKLNSRVVLSGAISSYNSRQAPGIFNYVNAISRQIRLEGFMVWDFKERFNEAVEKLSSWASEKKIIFREHVIEGIENAPKGLKMIMDGENTGKVLVRVVHDIAKI